MATPSLLAITLLVLALTAEPAHAAFVLAVDNLETDGVDVRIEDNGPGDSNPAAGNVEASFDSADLAGSVSAMSKPFEGTASAPVLKLDISGLSSAGGPLNVVVTDTDFAVGPTTGLASIAGATITGGSMVSFDISGDSANQEFGTGFGIFSVGPAATGIHDAELPDQPVTVPDPVGSLSMGVLVTVDGPGEGSIDMNLRMTLELVPAAPTTTTFPGTTTTVPPDTTTSTLTTTSVTTTTALPNTTTSTLTATSVTTTTARAAVTPSTTTSATSTTTTTLFMQPIRAKKVNVAYKPDKPKKNKLTFLARDRITAPLAGSEPDVVGAVLRVRDAAGQSMVVNLPASFWKSKKNGREYRYKDGKTQAGPCTQVLWTENKQIKAACKGAGVTLVPPLIEPIEVLLQMGDQGYCAAFAAGDVKKNKTGTFQAKGAAAPAPGQCN